MSLEDTGLLTQDNEPFSTMLVDARNVFSKLSRLAMLWMVYHIWLAGSSFAFNYYRHWVQCLLYQPIDAPFILLI